MAGERDHVARRAMKYMLVETYKNGPAPVYARARERGRMLPDGLRHVDSWVDAERLDRCFQVMETSDRALLEQWIERWGDLVAFEVVPVIDSAEAAARAG